MSRVNRIARIAGGELRPVILSEAPAERRISNIVQENFKLDLQLPELRGRTNIISKRTFVHNPSEEVKDEIPNFKTTNPKFQKTNPKFQKEKRKEKRGKSVKMIEMHTLYPIPYALCFMPYALCSMPYALCFLWFVPKN